MNARTRKPAHKFWDWREAATKFWDWFQGKARSRDVVAPQPALTGNEW